MSTKYLLSKPKERSISAVRPEFTTGDVVPRSGIYRICHHHNLAWQVPLLRSGIFPGCRKCTIPVEFELLLAMPIESARARFRLLMWQANAPDLTAAALRT